MKPTITIQQMGDGWQASIPVLRAEFAKLDGVKGRQNEHGPWIGGFGTTPDAALAELHAEIGRALLPVLLHEGPASEDK